MEFREFRKAIQEQFDKMQKEAKLLFVVDVDKEKMWEKYMEAFPKGTNQIFRVNREFDCSCCRHFIKDIGNVVMSRNGMLSTIWDIEVTDREDKFAVVARTMSEYIRSGNIKDVYISKAKKVGKEYNYEEDQNGTILRWEHFMIELPDKYVNTSGKSCESIRGARRDARNVFQRALNEITMDAVDTILELIASNSLYKGEEWKRPLIELKRQKEIYENVMHTPAKKELYAWEASVTVNDALCRIRNSSMGTLLMNLSEGMDLDAAVRAYEVMVAPANYKRPKAIFTKKMLEEAARTVRELGYGSALDRRFARLDDVSVNNLLFVDRSVSGKVGGTEGLFAELEKEITNAPKKFSTVETIQAKDFIKNVIPGAISLEVYLENKHASNLASLIAPVDPDARSMFKWDNGVSWAYAGNVTDSMKDRVKSAGGNVTGDLRFSIQWNEEDQDNCDMDAHCKEPNGVEIMYNHKRDESTGGALDVDIIHPDHEIAVENITWPDRDRMVEGKYVFFVHQFSGHGTKGFRAEIEFDGQTYSYDYNKPTRTGECVTVAEVTLNKDGTFTIKGFLPDDRSSREIWGMRTNEWIPVSVVCYSPNYWDTAAEDKELTGVGNRHLMFLLKGAKNEDTPNGMFNEFLKPELERHKRVFEALGAKCHVESADAENQLSGLGFAMTKRAEVVVKVTGRTERVMRVQF